jgi:uncharacterized protein (DUF1684 family)
MGDKKRTLRVYWSKKERDFEVWYPTQSADGGYALSQFCHVDSTRFDGRSFVEELKHRGFDTRTLKFSCELFPPPPPNNIAMARAGAEGVDADGREVDNASDGRGPGSEGV